MSIVSKYLILCFNNKHILTKRKAHRFTSQKPEDSDYEYAARESHKNAIKSTRTKGTL